MRAPRLVRVVLLVIPIAIATGSAVAFFLWSLDAVTASRWANPWLLWLLPIGGLASGLLYHRLGERANEGTHLIMDEVDAPDAGIPGRMAPLVLAGTLITHLFGGSAGREGTAVQMGASIASATERLVRRWRPSVGSLPPAERRLLLQAGIAAGFGAVFGTPIAGALFAIEVVGRWRHGHIALLPCAVAAFAADAVTTLWGAHHTIYDRVATSALGLGRMDGGALLRVALLGLACGLVSILLVRSTRGLHRLFARLVRQPWLRPAVGGAVVIALTLVVGNRDYLGLGVGSPNPDAVTILSSFRGGGAEPWSWALKLLFTAVTLGAGFKGGEVTPLFFIGATLGHSAGVALGAPVALFAAVGFVAVFAGATRTPIASTAMGMELFGSEIGVYLALACTIAVVCGDRLGVYRRAPVVGFQAPGSLPSA